jgi:uncharacterized repeat protein (TIGR02543 family)
VTFAGDKTLYAKWTPTYTVTFDTQGGTTIDSITKSVTYGSTYGDFPAVEREGYTFAGWWTGTDSISTEVTSSSEVTVSSDQTLYAMWTGNTYTITFDSQEGTTASPVDKTVTYGSTYGDLPTVEREGYTFGGWWTGTDSESDQVTGSSEVTVASDLTLYAKWTGNIYTIKFDTQDGTTTDSVTKSVSYGSTYGDFPTVVREEYYFGGWWTGTDIDSTQVTGSSEVTVAGNQTLYAKWTATGVGLIGPAGGYVFYDKGSYGDDGWRYLEAAPYGWYNGSADPFLDWGAYGYTVNPSATATAVGTGAANTANIVSYHDGLGDYYTNPTKYSENNDGTVAAKVCSEYSEENEGMTYDDWFLPSKDELDSMHDNLNAKGLGGFSYWYYWSSSESSSGWAWVQIYDNADRGTQQKYSKCSGVQVRAVRAF